MIYLDNSATTKPYPEVLTSFQQVAQDYFANPSSVHPLGGNTEKLLYQSKKQAAQLLGVSPEEVIFTSGGTEGNNLAIKGIAIQHQKRGNHIITSQIEHPSVLEACRALESLGFQITYLPVDKYGVVDLEDIKSAIREETILISIMHVNNELGSIQPIEEIGEIANKYPKLFFHVDYVQGLGKVPLSFKKARIDLCTMSSHKIHGLKGTGILYVRNGVKLFPLLHGGSQESAVRPGTENLAGIVAMVKALRMTLEKQKSLGNHLSSLNHILRENLGKNENVIINSPPNGAAHIINFSVPGLKPEVVIHALADKGIFISTKSACSSKLADESAVLAACGLDGKITTSGLRVSLSYSTTEEEVNQFCEIFNQTISELYQVMR